MTTTTTQDSDIHLACNIIHGLAAEDTDFWHGDWSAAIDAALDSAGIATSDSSNLSGSDVVQLANGTVIWWDEQNQRAVVAE